VASTATGILTARVTPGEARRSWPGWLALGLALLAVGVAGVLWDGVGTRLLLGTLGALAAARGAQLLRGGTRPAAAAVVVAGLAAVVVAVVSSAAAASVLTVAVPVGLLLTGVVLLARGGNSRRGGAALLVWALLVTCLLVAAGVAQGWARAGDVATVVTGLAVAAGGVPVLLGAVNLRAVASTPEPARPAACAGCACGAGGCGGLR
jgi:hypothetical protein